MNAIFVSIAAYRDPQLTPTIEDCLARAAHPERLRFGICWQHGPEEATPPWAADPRFQILDVDWRESRGACWARAEIMKLHAGQPYFLQLDSHHRFADRWDERALDQLARTGSAKPVLTSYAPAFDPDRSDTREHLPMQMNFDRFTDEAIVLFRPAELVDWRTRHAPAHARFLSGHFLFTIGDFVRDVPYDPELYFIGEEITLAVRAFTHGYDLFHPTEPIVWHEYSREYRSHKHWTDHDPSKGVEVAWYHRDRVSLEKVRRFLESPHVGPFGLGGARTIDEYQSYAGLDFRRRRAQAYTIRGEEPPNPPASADWASRMTRYSLDVTIERSRLSENLHNHRHWYFGVHDRAGSEIYRRDLDRPEILGVMAGHARSVIIHREFDTDREPVSWTVWPSTEAGGWLDRIDGPVPDETPLTLVTALMDIGRCRLAGHFARSFSDHYLVLFERLLQMPLPMVIHVEPEYEALVWRHRHPSDTKVIVVAAADLETLPWFGRVQEIRQSAAWLNQAEWLAQSPQAVLPHYNPLVLSKMLWLGDVARQNSLATSTVFWIDVGLLSTLPASLLATPALASRLAAAGEFLWMEYPVRPGSEIGGFPRDALAERAGLSRIDRRTTGALFGGRAERVVELADLYNRELAATLRLGLMGTEESLFTILAHRHPEKSTRYLLASDGLLTAFFADLLRGTMAWQRRS